MDEPVAAYLFGRGCAALGNLRFPKTRRRPSLRFLGVVFAGCKNSGRKRGSSPSTPTPASLRSQPNQVTNSNFCRCGIRPRS